MNVWLGINFIFSVTNIGDKVIVNAEAAKTITMQLVDFMYEPIVLKSPMFVTLKIKLIPNQTFN